MSTRSVTNKVHPPVSEGALMRTILPLKLRTAALCSALLRMVAFIWGTVVLVVPALWAVPAGPRATAHHSVDCRGANAAVGTSAFVSKGG
jgi:hypothetical protein